MDVILNSGGAFNYQSLMTMPVPAIQMFINKLNKQREEQNNQMKKMSKSR
jgi:hypothetical protein